jgi:hypothetical protein
MFKGCGPADSLRCRPSPDPASALSGLGQSGLAGQGHRGWKSAPVASKTAFATTAPMIVMAGSPPRSGELGQIEEHGLDLAPGKARRR